jgi:hypothetical protein
MKKLFSTLLVIAFIIIILDTVGAQDGALFPNANDRVGSLLEGQENEGQTLFPSINIGMSAFIFDRLNNNLTGSEPTVDPITWNGGERTNLGIVSPLFDNLEDRFAGSISNFDFKIPQPTAPGIYWGQFTRRTGQSNTSSVTTITGIPGQQPQIDFSQYGSGDKTSSNGYYIEIME